MSNFDGPVIIHQERVPDIALAPITPVQCISCNTSGDPRLMTHVASLQGHVCCDVQCLAWACRMLEIENERWANGVAEDMDV